MDVRSLANIVHTRSYELHGVGFSDLFGEPIDIVAQKCVLQPLEYAPCLLQDRRFRTSLMAVLGPQAVNGVLSNLGTIVQAAGNTLRR